MFFSSTSWPITLGRSLIFLMDIKNSLLALLRQGFFYPHFLCYFSVLLSFSFLVFAISFPFLPFVTLLLFLTGAFHWLFSDFFTDWELGQGPILPWIPGSCAVGSEATLCPPWSTASGLYVWSVLLKQRGTANSARACFLSGAEIQCPNGNFSAGIFPLPPFL